MWLFKFLLGAAALYAVIVTALYAGQTWLLFPTWAAGAGARPPGDARPLAVETADGLRLAGVYIPAADDDAAPVLLAFAGNALNAQDLAVYLHKNLPGTAVAAFHYRGYAPSTGRPSAAGILADGLRIHDFLRREFPGRPLITLGISLGAGPAAHLAAHRTLAGVILVTPFDSLTEVARHHYFWVPVRLLLRHHMPAAADMAKVRAPAAVIAAAKDSVIPPARTRALSAAVPNLVFDRTIAGVGHNDIYDSAAFTDALAQALAAVRRAPAAAD